jgi:hypothetical protein
MDVRLLGISLHSTKSHSRAGGTVPMPSKHKALISNPSTTKKKTCSFICKMWTIHFTWTYIIRLFWGFDEQLWKCFITYNFFLVHFLETLGDLHKAQVVHINWAQKRNHLQPTPVGGCHRHFSESWVLQDCQTNLVVYCLICSSQKQGSPAVTEVIIPDGKLWTFYWLLTPTYGHLEIALDWIIR